MDAIRLLVVVPVKPQIHPGGPSHALRLSGSLHRGCVHRVQSPRDLAPQGWATRLRRCGAPHSTATGAPVQPSRRRIVAGFLHARATAALYNGHPQGQVGAERVPIRERHSGQFAAGAASPMLIGKLRREERRCTPTRRFLRNSAAGMRSNIVSAAARHEGLFSTDGRVPAGVAVAPSRAPGQRRFPADARSRP